MHGMMGMCWPAHMSRRQAIRYALITWIIGARWRGDATIAILDCGVERGFQGAALRAAFPLARLYGVDLWKPYLDAVRPFYDTTYHADVVSHLQRYLPEAADPLPRPDVIVAAEIVEHLTDEQGLALLSTLAQLSEAGTLCIVTAPLDAAGQGPLDGNPHQVHRSVWTRERMASLGWPSHTEMTYENCGIYARGPFWG